MIIITVFGLIIGASYFILLFGFLYVRGKKIKRIKDQNKEVFTDAALQKRGWMMFLAGTPTWFLVVSGMLATYTPLLVLAGVVDFVFMIFAAKYWLSAIKPKE